MTHKKQIVLDFYSCYNLGDDLFVETFAKHFSDCEIHLLVNPKCVPKKLPDNVRILHFSHVDLRLRRISNLASHCTNHHRYAANQFSGLESYLNEKESVIESSIV